MKWFNIPKIIEEIKKIRWPKKEELGKTFIDVCIFVAFFMIFFFAADLLVSYILKLLNL